MRLFFTLFIISFFVLVSCTDSDKWDNPLTENEVIMELYPIVDINKMIIEKNFLYDQHTLADTFSYKQTTREFQWKKIRQSLFLIDSLQSRPSSWGVVQNYKNRKGRAPLVRNHIKDAYGYTADSLGFQQYQSAPLYTLTDTVTAERYIRDGSFVKVIEKGDKFTEIETVYNTGRWFVPTNYIQFIDDSVVFKKAIFIDRANQNIATIEKVDSKWLVRSMNPATTGVRYPPYKQETPLGIFILQEKRTKMLYLKDGTDEMGGFAPSANRFTGGAFIHGVPIDLPRTEPVEYSWSLGTTPRSHMCIRNATSHAKFIFDWAPLFETLIFILD